MAAFLRAPGWKRDYVVSKPFRFSGRNYDQGQEFNPRRADIPRWRLDSLYREGCLFLPDPDEDAEFRETEAERLDLRQDPQPTRPKKEDEEDAALLGSNPDSEAQAMEWLQRLTTRMGPKPVPEPESQAKGWLKRLASRLGPKQTGG